MLVTHNTTKNKPLPDSKPQHHEEELWSDIHFLTYFSMSGVNIYYGLDLINFSPIACIYLCSTVPQECQNLKLSLCKNQPISQHFYQPSTPSSLYWMIIVISSFNVTDQQRAGSEQAKSQTSKIELPLKSTVGVGFHRLYSRKIKPILHPSGN